MHQIRVPKSQLDGFDILRRYAVRFFIDTPQGLDELTKKRRHWAVLVSYQRRLKV
jgi:hypothetical protein